MDDPRQTDPSKDPARGRGPRRNLPVMLFILGLVVIGLLLFHVKSGDVKEMTVWELDELIMKGGPRNNVPGTLDNPGFRIVQYVRIINGSEVRGPLMPEQNLFPDRKEVHVAHTGSGQTNALDSAMKGRWKDRLGAENVREEPGTTTFTQILVGLLPWIAIGLLIWFVFLRQMRAGGGPGGVLNFGRSRARIYVKERVSTTFEDVAGVEEAKQDVKEIVEFLKSPAKFTKIGARIPRGVLLVGPPGCGKTLLAKAIAGEAGVPFFSISGSDFVEMFVGVGASRVRDLFRQARETAPCILFLDEIDAVGRRRGTGLGGGHDEREQTLNQILVEMDGFDTEQGIILIAATNRPDVLDPALLRPGRFDRQIVIDLPDVTGREAILRVHARRVKLSPAVDLHVVARATPGFSGADLEAVVNEAALLAVLGGRDFVEGKDFEEARDKIRFGRARKSRVLTLEDRRITAYHEAGHALMTELQEEADPLHKVTIIPRGMALGLTMRLPEKDMYGLGRKRILADLRICFGGRVGEELVIGDISTGARNDIEQATELARLMVTRWGMSEKVGPISYAEGEEHLFLGREVTRTVNHSEATAVLIDEEMKRFLTEALEDCRKTLGAHIDGLHRVAQALLEHETLSGEEVRAVLAGQDVKVLRAGEKEREDRARRGAGVPKPQAEPGVTPGKDVRPAPGAEPQGGYAY
jgi:cell division protease FtsH